MLKGLAVFFLALAALTLSQPVDYYHFLHLPHHPPLHPAYPRPPPTPFACGGRARGYYADVDAGCQLVSTDLCANGTLFNEQFQVCDHFYNVRCGSPLEDL
ncbi:hypothetical protein JYU34_001137 [Plutella xylostella]|uniref:Chitin-binding type-2 domain-containing protein n=1 Tax=Plutella xylostella TaxID=51655 RepID=A0ABQ7R636_PLUXY|nr:hypothetical protein JYU34_001137 [Plutella xylostella]